MATYIAPDGNLEVWETKPAGYFTPEEWAEAHPPLPPTEEDLKAAVQARLDDFARERGYDGILSAASYAASTDPRFAAEGRYAVQVRDETWLAAFAVFAQVEAGERDMPAVEEFLAELPELEWPGGPESEV